MHRLLLLASIALFVAAGPRGASADDRRIAPPPGVRVVTAAHSFHFWMQPILQELATSAGIRGHQMVAVEMLGGSQIIQHWNLPDDKSQVKPVLLAGGADVLTLSPIYLPDEGIANFVKLGLEHNPKLRVTVQEFWLPFDEIALWQTRAAGVTIDRDSKTIEQLREAHAPYFREMDEHVRALNQQIGRQAVFIVPVGQAVLALREKVIKGEVPGVSQQSKLFKDPVGHPAGHIQALATYCHYAVIYGRNPVGLPVPGALAVVPEAEKINPLLQQLAWEAVIAHPLSGVKARAVSAR